jgi:hypothetical protein
MSELHFYRALEPDILGVKPFVSLKCEISIPLSHGIFKADPGKMDVLLISVRSPEDPPHTTTKGNSSLRVLAIGLVCIYRKPSFSQKLFVRGSLCANTAAYWLTIPPRMDVTTRVIPSRILHTKRRLPQVVQKVETPARSSQESTRFTISWLEPMSKYRFFFFCGYFDLFILTSNCFL